MQTDPFGIMPSILLPFSDECDWCCACSLGSRMIGKGCLEPAKNQCEKWSRCIPSSVQREQEACLWLMLFLLGSGRLTATITMPYLHSAMHPHRRG